MSFAMMAKKQNQNNITAVREAKGVTLEQLAERTGLSVSYLSRMARSDRNVSLKNLNKIASALKIDPTELIDTKQHFVVPIITWVSAGTMMRDDARQDAIGEMEMPDLDQRGKWIALRVEGDSMDRISPPGSVIFVDVNDRKLVPNACYIIGDGDDQVTYKRYRTNPARFEPVSTNDTHEPIFPDGEAAVIGRVRRSMIDM